MIPGALERSLFLIRAASLLVPAPHREEWRREWEAEIRYAWWSMRERGDSPSSMGRQLRRFSWGSLQDAVWHRLSVLNREDLARGVRYRVQSPWFCLGSLAAIILLIAAASGGLSATRAVLLPLPYADAGRIATVSQGGRLSIRSGIHPEWVRLWRSKSKLTDGAAAYNWKESVAGVSGHPSRVLNAEVSDNFFTLLGAATSAGRTFRPGDLLACPDCVVISDEFWRRRFASGGASIRLDGKRYRVIGVLDKRFWFLSRHIAVWSIAPFESKVRTGVVVRLRPDVARAAVEAEMESIVQASGVSPWDSLVAISPLQARVRSVFGSYALALGMAFIIAATGLRLRLRNLHRGGARALFFGSKTLMLLMAVLLSGLEFTRAPSITILGGTDLLTEPLSTWLFLLGCMGVLSWSIYDQRRRCRICLRRLGIAVHVGRTGCLLLDWAGTELMCVEGHGMLQVCEMASSWQEPEQWTSLDDSWFELFAHSGDLRL